MLNITNHQGNANQSQNKIYHFTTNSYLKKGKTSVGQDVEEMEPSCTVAGNINWYGHYGKQHVSSSKNEKYNYLMIQQFHSSVLL